MRLLFIAMTPLCHNTSAILRAKGYISGAYKNGHICDVITLKGDENDYLYDSSDESFIKQNVNEYFTFNKISSYEKLKKTRNDSKWKSWIKRILKFILHCVSVYDAQNVNAKRILEVNIDYNQYDFIISVSDPKSSHNIVMKLIKSKAINNIEGKWIQCWGDPWLKDITLRNNAILKRMIKSEESKLLSQSCRIIYASPFTLEEQKKCYPRFSGKMVCINQVTQVHEEKNLEEEFLVGYFGDYCSEVRDINPFYDCCVKYKYNAVIVGNSDVELREAPSIKIMPRVSHSEVENLESHTSILVSICNKKGTQIPGKVFYQAGFHKPIVIIVDGEHKEEMKSYFETFNRYILCGNSVEEIRRAIMEAKESIQSDYKLDQRLKDTYCAERLLDIRKE